MMGPNAVIACKKEYQGQPGYTIEHETDIKINEEIEHKTLNSRFKCMNFLAIYIANKIKIKTEILF